jgi:hypothetical protein
VFCETEPRLLDEACDSGAGEVPSVLMSNKEVLEEPAELMRTGVETAIEIVEAAEDLSIPGVGLGLSLLQRAHRAKLERQTKEFFTHLAVHLGADDADAAARLIETKMEEPWAQDAVESGFRTMMACISEGVRPCVAALVSEYFFEGRAHDRAFQAVGALLSGSTNEDLPTLGQLTNDLVYVAPADGVRNVFFNDAKRLFWVGVSKSHTLCSAVHLAPRGFFSTLELIRRSGIASGATGLDYRYESGRSVFEFQPADDPAVCLLRRCLAPVLGLQEIPEPSWVDGLGGQHNELPK